MVGSNVYRSELPRIYELRDLLPNPLPPDAYFHDLDKTLTEIPQKLRQFRDVERDLQSLDTSAWSFLKSELVPLLTARDPTRNWQPLFDKLNQAKAYNHLKSAGYCNIEFIRVSAVKGQQTPDLRATLGSTRALCEVKTINVSEIEARRMKDRGIGTTTDQLDAGFFNKLRKHLDKAKAQMSNHATKKIAYVVVSGFDNDPLNEYADRRKVQIDLWLENNRVPRIGSYFGYQATNVP